MNYDSQRLSFRIFVKRQIIMSFTEDQGKNNTGSGQDDNENRRDSFLDSIESLALRQKADLPEPYSVQGRDLTIISIDDYPEVESTETTNGG
jgi:hypothetical protein